MIRVQNLVKLFGAKRAVDNISFSVERGQVLGFLGPNGAGKSTTMRMITGFIPPTEGTVSVGGFDIAENPIAAKKLIGYLPENAPAYTDMTVNGFLNFVAEVRVARAKCRLADRDGLIKEIAYECGFRSQSAFAHAFRRATGQTPQEYRQNLAH